MDTITILFTIDQINSLLSVLGDASYVKSAQNIALIQEQGTPQFEAIQANQALEEVPVVEEGNF